MYVYMYVCIDIKFIQVAWKKRILWLGWADIGGCQHLYAHKQLPFVLVVPHWETGHSYSLFMAIPLFILNKINYSHTHTYIYKYYLIYFDSHICSWSPWFLSSSYYYYLSCCLTTCDTYIWCWIIKDEYKTRNIYFLYCLSFLV